MPKNVQTTVQLYSFSHARKVMLKILQARLQQYMNREIPDVQTGFRKGRGTINQIANIRWIIEKARKYRKTIIEWERLEISSRKLEMPKNHFIQGWPG